MMAILNSAQLPIVERFTDWENCVEPRLRKSARSEQQNTTAQAAVVAVSVQCCWKYHQENKNASSKLFKVRQ